MNDNSYDYSRLDRMDGLGAPMRPAARMDSGSLRPSIKVFLVILLVGAMSFAGAWLAGKASADPNAYDPVSEPDIAGARYGESICQRFVAEGGIRTTSLMEIGTILIKHTGLGDVGAGEAVVIGVDLYCPEYAEELQEVARSYQERLGGTRMVA